MRGNGKVAAVRGSGGFVTNAMVSLWAWLSQSRSRRVAAVVLALVIEGLIILLFLTMLSGVRRPEKPPTPKTFAIRDPGAGKAEPKPDTAAKPRPRGGRVEHAKLNEPDIVPPPVPPVQPPPDANILWLTRPQYAASDIGQNQPQGPRNNADASGAENGTGDAPGDSRLAEGKGPNGEPIYVAEWYRRPTHAQLSPYIPERARGRPGWGMIVCKTAPNYRVEDCRELGDAPRGTGYAGAVRQAAFQFRVRPPRKGGKSLVGALVNIRIDYTIREDADGIED